LPILLAAVIIFMIGTEIRVRIEDRLLAERSGERFFQYQHRIAAYVPFLR
jgi:protein-S-isoprenylcysteine O-methyltransferase Ste14